MNYDEIERLRKSGNLDEAYQMASLDLKEASQIFNSDSQNEDSDYPDQQFAIDDDNQEVVAETPLTLSKRAMAWVLYEYLKRNTEKENFQEFLNYLMEYNDLGLSDSEKMVTNQVLWLIAKMAFEYTKEPDFDVADMEELFEITSQLEFSRQNKGYSMLFKAFHKALKDSEKYIELADWWDFNNFIRDDYNFTQNDDGTKTMAVVEQAYSKFSRHLINALESAEGTNREIILKEKIKNLIPRIEDVCRRNKFYKKLPQYHVRLLIAGGEYPKAFSILLAKAKERNDEFWVWEMIADAFATEPEKKIACLCSALRCRMNGRNLVATREKLTHLFTDLELYDEAKTEIAQILRFCHQQKLEIPDTVAEWGDQLWYRQAVVKTNNEEIYQNYAHIIEEIIYHDIPQKKVVVEFVNQPRKILNFIALDFSKGYFKFGNSLAKVKEGDVLLVRLKKIDEEGRFELINGKKVKEKHIEGLLKDFAGEVIIMPGKPFGFVSGLFIPPDMCKKYHLENGDRVTGMSMISFNKKKEEWGWKVISLD